MESVKPQGFQGSGVGPRRTFEAKNNLVKTVKQQDEEHSGGGMVGQMRPGFMLQQMMNTIYPGQQHGNMDHMARMAPGMGQRMHHPNMMRPMMGGRSPRTPVPWIPHQHVHCQLCHASQHQSSLHASFLPHD